MRPLKRSVRMGGPAIVLAAAAFFFSSRSDAHFTLDSPPSSMSQDSIGSPQKLGPCGDESGGTPTGTVTAFQSGQTITVTIDEKIFHPGHYRIALATNDRSELPAEPIVTPGTTPCGSVPIEDPPVFPVLADNVFPHTTAFKSPQSVQITLPADVTCTHCTLQVIEFMSDHGLNVPGGCFYHHCADISLQTSPVMSTTATGSGGSGGGGGNGAAMTHSCSVATFGADEGVGSALAGLCALVALGTRRTRRPGTVEARRARGRLLR